MERSFVACDVCCGKGKLWLGRNDYVECAECLATGKVEMRAYKVRRTERVIFVPGMPGFRTLTNRLVNWS